MHSDLLFAAYTLACILVCVRNKHMNLTANSEKFQSKYVIIRSDRVRTTSMSTELSLVEPRLCSTHPSGT